MMLPLEKILKRDMSFCDISQKKFFYKAPIDMPLLLYPDHTGTGNRVYGLLDHFHRQGQRKPYISFA